jgi:hypothetical protein
MIASREEEAHAMVWTLAHDPGGEDAGSLGILLALDFLAQSSHPHPGVIAEEDRGLGRVFLQVFEHRLQAPGHSIHLFPLHRGGQGNSQALLQSFQPMEGHPAAIAHQTHHHPDTDIILFGPGLGRRRRREHFAAGVAAQLLQLMDQCAHGRLSSHADRHRRLLPPPQLSLGALRAPLSRGQGSV